MGGAGDDVLMATRRDGSGAVGFEGTLKGGPGNDTLDAGPGDGDRVFGGSGNDTVAGGWGDDTVVGGPGRDVMLGGTGRDLLRAVDGARDRLDCGGGGKDTAKIDGRDKVRSCETVGS
jgi:Ca2+-binding RTX toxin-like protein